MKKIITFIIIFISFFSSFYNTFASEGYIEKLLDINYGVEKYKLNLNKIDVFDFRNTKNKRIYSEMKKIDKILKKSFDKKYREGEYEYYQMNGITKNYNNFIYHTNKFFFFIKMKENNNYTELDTAILNSYKNLRNSYKNIQYIIKK